VNRTPKAHRQPQRQPHHHESRQERGQKRIRSVACSKSEAGNRESIRSNCQHQMMSSIVRSLTEQVQLRALSRYGTCKAALCKWLSGNSTRTLYSTELHADSQVTSNHQAQMRQHPEQSATVIQLALVPAIARPPASQGGPCTEGPKIPPR